MSGTPKEEFKTKRLLRVREAAHNFLDTNQPGPLEQAIDDYNSSDRDYDEMIFRAEMAEKAHKAREASKLPKGLLMTFYKLQESLVAHDKDPDQQRRWIDAFRMLMREVDKDQSLLAEEEAPQWIARGSVFLEGPELTHLFRRLWPYCTTKDNGRISSILGAISYSLPTNGVNLLKEELTLDEKKAYPTGLVEAYRRIKRQW